MSATLKVVIEMEFYSNLWPALVTNISEVVIKNGIFAAVSDGKDRIFWVWPWPPCGRWTTLIVFLGRRRLHDSPFGLNVSATVMFSIFLGTLLRGN